MNLGHLKAFYSVAREQSFTRASEKLKIAQPSLSKTIRSFEECLGVRLLERTTREVRLTSDGQIVFEYAQRIFDDVEKLERVLKRTAISTKSPLQIGMTDAIAHCLAEGIASFGELHSLYPIVQTGGASDLLDLVARRKIEFALAFHVPSASEAVKVEPFSKVRFHLVASKRQIGNAEALNRFIGSREVENENAKRFPTLELYKKQNRSASIQFSSNSLLTHLELVRCGYGVSVLPNFLVSKELERKSMVDLMPKEHLQFQMKLLTHRAFGISGQGKKLLSELEPILRRA